MGQYTATSQRALATITKKGAAVVFLTPGVDAYDPATDMTTDGPDVSVTGRAVQTEGDPDRFAALSLVLVDPVTLLVAASGLTVTPTPGMRMTWAGAQFTLRDVESVAPDGVPIVYTITGSR